MVTPNLVEAAALINGEAIKDIAGMKSAAARLQAQGPKYVLIKGGHLEGTRMVSMSLAMQFSLTNSFLLACMKRSSVSWLLDELVTVDQGVRLPSGIYS